MYSLELKHAPTLALRASPETVAFARLLALPALELAQAVEREAEENPAIELVERPECGRCRRPLVGDACPICQAWPAGAGPASRTAELREPVAPRTLADDLLAQIGPLTRADEEPL